MEMTGNWYDHVLHRVHGILYKTADASDVKEGDLVFDTKDKTFGVCDMRIGNKIAIKEDYVAELAVPIERVRKLIPVPENNSLN